jgi:hypothetical protein
MKQIHTILVVGVCLCDCAVVAQSLTTNDERWVEIEESFRQAAASYKVDGQRPRTNGWAAIVQSSITNNARRAEIQEVFRQAVASYKLQRAKVGRWSYKGHRVGPHGERWETWVEVPAILKPILEAGREMFPYLRTQNADDLYMEELKDLCLIVVSRGYEPHGPYRWKESKELFHRYHAPRSRQEVHRTNDSDIVIEVLY